MFRLSRGDGKDGETATDALDETAKPPEDEGVPGIETPDGVDRGATGSLPRDGPKALGGIPTDPDRSPDGSAAGPEGPMDGLASPILDADQDYRPEGRQSRQHSGRSVSAGQRRSRSGALEGGRAGSGYEDRRGGYEDRRGAAYDERRGGGYEHRRGGYEERERGVRSPAQRVAPKPRQTPVPSTPKPAAVDTDKLATPAQASFGKKPAKDAEHVAVEDAAPAPPTLKRGWFGWASKKGSGSSKALETILSNDLPPTGSVITGKGLDAIDPASPIANDLVRNPQVGAPRVGPLGSGATSPGTSASSSTVSPSSPVTSPFAAASKTPSGSALDSLTATTPGGVSYTSLYPQKTPDAKAPMQAEQNGQAGTNGDMAGGPSKGEPGARSSCFCLGGGKPRRPASAGAQKA